jgi:hypothetical protein
MALFQIYFWGVSCLDDWGWCSWASAWGLDRFRAARGGHTPEAKALESLVWRRGPGVETQEAVPVQACSRGWGVVVEASMLSVEVVVVEPGVELVLSFG